MFAREMMEGRVRQRSSQDARDFVEARRSSLPDDDEAKGAEAAAATA
jgi:hypothetical protein